MVNVQIEASPRHRAELIAEQYEALRAEAKAIEIQSKALSKELLTLAKDNGLFEKGADGKERLFTQAATYTLSRKITETFMDAFKAYRVLKVINLKTLASVICFDPSKLALAVQEGRMTPEQLDSLKDSSKVSEYLTPSRPAKK